MYVVSLIGRPCNPYIPKVVIGLIEDRFFSFKIFWLSPIQFGVFLFCDEVCM